VATEGVLRAEVALASRIAAETNMLELMDYIDANCRTKSAEDVEILH